MALIIEWNTILLELFIFQYLLFLSSTTATPIVVRCFYYDAFYVKCQLTDEIKLKDVV